MALKNWSHDSEMAYRVKNTSRSMLEPRIDGDTFSISGNRDAEDILVVNLVTFCHGRDRRKIILITLGDIWF